MYRYVALQWDDRDSRAARQANVLRRRFSIGTSEFSVAFEVSGLVVLHAGTKKRSAEAKLLHGEHGVVLGHVFKRTGLDETSIVEGNFDPRETERIIVSEGRRLVDEYWGNYVAFLHDSKSRRGFVLRDPIGRLPCYRYSISGVNIYFSHMEDCANIDDLSYSINWRYVAGHLLCKTMRSRSTGLEEVEELLPGECTKYSAEGESSSFYWEPRKFAHEAMIDDLPLAKELLRKTTDYCVSAWASCYTKILHQLSGGLDSSIVASSLSRAEHRPEVICLNHYTPSAEGDERRFARIAASSTGLELIEREKRKRGVQVEHNDIANFPALAKPTAFYLTARNGDELRMSVATENESDAIFSGTGGDLVYFVSKSPLLAADYVYHHGVNARLFEVVADTAALSEYSFWSVLWEALSYGLRRQHRSPIDGVLSRWSFLTTDAIALLSAEDILHPWILDAFDLPPGKHDHLSSITCCQMTLWPQRSEQVADIVHPLISQPLIELLCRIPTYILSFGGRDRALARAAFSDVLPSEIINRRTKGAITRYVNRTFMKNAAFAQELLLDGVLAREKILDTEKVVHALANSQSDEDAIIEVAMCLGTELWARRWASGGIREAA